MHSDIRGPSPRRLALVGPLFYVAAVCGYSWLLVAAGGHGHQRAGHSAGWPAARCHAACRWPTGRCSARRDAVLCAWGATLQAGLRASDAVLRIGGEEFALLPPQAASPQALQRVQALRERLASQPPPAGDPVIAPGPAA